MLTIGPSTPRWEPARMRHQHLNDLLLPLARDALGLVLSLACAVELTALLWLLL